MILRTGCAQPEQILGVARSSPDGAGQHRANAPATGLRRDGHIGHRRHAIPVLAHHPGAGQPGTTHFELWLHQDDPVPADPAHRPQHRQHQGQRDEAEVGDDQVEQPAHVVRPDAPQVRAGPVHDPGVGAQAGRELAVPDVEGDHLTSAAFEEDLCETAGGRAAVETSGADHRVGHLGPGRQGMIQLEVPAADGAGTGPRVPCSQADRLADGHGLGGSGRQHAVDLDGSGVHEIASVAARARQATVHQGAVEPDGLELGGRVLR